METIETETVTPVGPARTEPEPGPQECDQCGAALDSSQRYCVVCGAHRRHVHDPAARYLVTTSAHARDRARAAGAQGGKRRRSPTLGLALALVLVPVVAAIGVAVGRSSGNDDQLLKALRSQHPQVINAGGADSGSARGKAVASKVKDTTNFNPANGGKVLNRTPYGVVHQVTGFKATAADLAKGKQIVQHIQQTQGKDYVNAQRGLPDQISVP